ncbi:Subtilisin-like protein [Mycena indigotica]|uniref:tripeptidyl-peptidase II n=1 Tax=Mycena indigotica TaxID=2126181 RepID=A0A8H6T1S1_9AGAR|nr:Subtilisin-like protein [Mycena indigotica]KAF7309456.1 Subtilisin-like protein [Mycena indigotica]
MLWSAFVFGLAQFAAAKPLASKRWATAEPAVKHAWLETPGGWEYHSAPSADHLLELRIGLKQDKIDELIKALYEVSDPVHHKYGQHLSKEEVDALVAPHPDSIEAVESWLQYHDIDPANAHFRSGGGEWITLHIPVGKAEKMLDTKYGVYYNSKSDEYIVRTMSYSLPQELHSHIDVITPTTYFGTMRAMRSTSFIQDAHPITALNSASFAAEISPLAVPASCGSTVTPACLRAMYNTTNYVPKATATNKLGIAGYLEEFANDADLQTFFSRFRTDAAGAKLTHIQLNGGLNDQTDPGVEANLDVRKSLLSYGWTGLGVTLSCLNHRTDTGGSPPFIADSATTSNTNEPYLDWLNFVLNQTTVPQTFTTSYGDDEQTVPVDYATSVCNLFAQLGARGASIMFSSGDEGVGAGSCRTNDGTNKVLFQPAFPASCPFVTAVGGTTRVNPEVGISFSGGGFSRYFSQPSYQTTAVSTFLTGLGTKFAGLYNAGGRAYPDVSAASNGFQVVISGRTSSVGGTSASSPTVAAIVSLLNDFRISEGKAPLGFLNPLIYSTASTGFNDIVSGSNPGCGQTGFTAGAGWDPVTGWGTPDFLRLQALVG